MDQDRFKIAAGIRFVTIEGQAVLLDEKRGMYMGLDEIGTSIWHELERGVAIDEICRRLLQHYDVTHEVLATDVRAFLAKLQEKGLIEVIKKNPGS